MKLILIELNFSAGTKTVLESLVPHFSRQWDEVHIATSNSRRRQLSDKFGNKPNLSFFSSDLTDTELLPIHTKVFNLALKKLNYPFNSKFFIRQRIIQKYIDINKITHAFIPWIFDYRIPRLKNIKIGSMIMDLAWHDFPELVPIHSRETLDRSFDHNLEQSSALFPISNFTNEQTIKHFPRHSHKLTVVPHGANIFSEPQRRQQRVLKRPLLLYPASTTPNKNHPTLIEAATDLWNKGLDFDLVLTGYGTDLIPKLSKDNENSYLRKCNESYCKIPKAFRKRLDCLGFTDESTLKELYASCTAVTLPSIYEGFGLPLIEAIQFNAPVLTSDIQPFIEQIDRYEYNPARVCKSNTPKAWSESIESILSEDFSDDRSTTNTNAWTWLDAASAYSTKLKSI